MYIFDSLKINVSQVVHETIDGETILLNLETGNYYSMDQMGVVIWQLLENEICVNDLIEALKNRFPDQDSEISASIPDFIAELIQEDLLIIHERPTAGNDSRQSGWNPLDTLEKIEYSVYCPPVLNKYTDMQDLLQLDPIHEVKVDTGWPTAKPDNLENKTAN